MNPELAKPSPNRGREISMPLGLFARNSTLKHISIACAVFGGILLLEGRGPAWRWESELWYSNVSGTGGGLAAFLGAVLLLIRPFRNKSEYLGIAAGALIASGISALSGIFLNDVSVSLFLKCQAMFLGATILSLLWLPEHLVTRYFTGKSALFLALTTALPLSLWFIFWGREVVPPIIEFSWILSVMKRVTLMSGVLFLLVLPRIHKVIPAPEQGLIFVVGLYLGLACITYPFTHLWAADWWLVQFVQNAPYFLAIRYVLKTFTFSQKALFESEARFRGLFAAAPVGIGIIDNENDCYRQANPALCRLTGFTEAELSNTQLGSIIFAGDVRSSFELRNKLLRGELSDYCDTRKHVTREGRIAWVKVRGTLIHVGGDRVEEFRIVEDVTGEKEAKDKVAALVTELSHKNERLERFTSVASHDLRSPLNTISSYVELVSGQLAGNSDPEIAEFLGFALDGCVRMRSLIDDLLSYARASHSPTLLEPVNFNEALAETMKNLDLEIKEAHARIILSSALPVVAGNMIQLTRLLQNLIGNAIKYRGEEDPVVLVKMEEQDGEWRFSITDNGIGFDMKYSEKIFADFQRLNSDYSGSGLGLPICKSIVNRHGGRIWATSSLGKGSTFYFTLPKEKAPEADSPRENSITS